MANAQLLASDTFASGSLSAAKWTVISTQSESQITGSPFVAEPPAAGTAGRQYYSGITWPNDQASEATFTVTTTGTNSVDLWVRVQSGAYSGYVVSISSAGTATLYKCVAGSFTSLVTLGSLTIGANDVWILQVAGANLSVYQNNNHILHWADATFTSGYPGFSQSASSGVVNSQVKSWRGYSSVQQDGVWQKQNIILPALSGDITSGAGGTANASMLYEGNAQILSGTVFKMWFSAGPGGGGNIYYAESTDGLNWTRRGTTVIAGQSFPFIIKNGSTYYVYTSGTPGSAGYNVYTSSDGITWSLQATNILPLGGAGSWDQTISWYMMPVAIISGTWYALYSAGNNASVYQLSLGLATSSDGITWTKYAGNPVATDPNGGSIVHGGAFTQIGSTWYFWCYGNQPGGGGQAGAENALDPGEGVRYKTTDFIHWTLDSHSVHRSQVYEGTNFHGGQCYPNGIFNVNGKTYFYLQSAPSDNGAPLFYQLSVAIGPAKIAQIVRQPEDGMPQIASDAFTSGTGNLSANWTTISGLTALQIVNGNLVEATATSTYCGASYTGAAFTDNQYSEIALATLGASQTVFPAARVQSNGNCYIAKCTGTTGSQNSNFGIFKRISGTNTQIGASATITPAVGDKFRISVVNVNGIPTLTLYQNQFQCLQVEDWSAAIPSGGSPGMLVNTSTLAQAQLSGFAGGNAAQIPIFPNGAGLLLGVG